MNKRQLIVIAASLGIIAIGIILFKVQTSGKKVEQKPIISAAAKYVNATDAIFDNYRSEVTAYGRLLPVNKVELYSEVPGIMLATNKKFKVGNNFSKGEPLIKIDNEENKLTLYSAKSSFLNLLTSSMADIKADFPDDYKLWQKYLDEFKIEKDIAELPKVNNDKLKYFLSNRQIFSQFYNIKNSELKLTKFTINAPFNGSVIMSVPEPGTYIRQGQKLGEFTSVGTYELELNITATDIQYINIGDEAKITSSEIDGIFTGRIIRIAKNIDPNTQTVKAFINVSGSNLREGMYMKAIVKGIEIKEAIKLPRKALLNNEFVLIIEDSTLGKVPIELVKLTEYDAYIRGVEPGKVIITEPLANAEIGMIVKRINK